MYQLRQDLKSLLNSLSPVDKDSVDLLEKSEIFNEAPCSKLKGIKAEFGQS